MKFPFHVSQKNMRCNHWMLTYEIFFANLHHFLSFFWYRHMFQVRHFACFVSAQASLQLFFQLLLSVLQYQPHRIAQSNRVVLHLFQCDWVLFRMLYLLLSFLIYIFLTNRLYLSRTDLGGTLKKVGLMNLK